MKRIFYVLVFLVLSQMTFAQDDVNSIYETARTFMRTGDFDNAIVVLNRAYDKDRTRIDIQRDLAMCHYLKRDYANALDVIKKTLDRDNVDVMSFQIAGNIYRAIEETKECEKVYKKGLKKFPNSGPLYNEYGELLTVAKGGSPITQWENGIKADPGYAANYYNAAMYYSKTSNKVWALVYGEIYANMESLSDRSIAVKQMLLQTYKEYLFAGVSVPKGDSKIPFTTNYLQAMGNQTSVANKGINVESLTMIRTRFLLDWFKNSAANYPFRLFDYQLQLLQNGMFEAYNQWLFGPADNLAAYDNWSHTHTEQFKEWTSFQRSRVFKMPVGQYYQAL